MIYATFNNCDFSTVYNTSNFTVQMNNSASNINEINLLNCTTLLNGIFNSKINISGSSNLNLCEDFNLINNTIGLISTDSQINTINIYGNLNNLINDLNIESDLNIYLILSLSTLNSSKSVNIYCDSPAKSESSTFKISDISPPITLTGDKIPVNLIYSTTGNLIIDSKLNTCDFINGQNIVLSITPDKTINNYINILNKTFTSIAADESSISKLVESTSTSLPINAVLYNIVITDGTGTISIPSSISTSSNISASIILGYTEFRIDN